MVDKQVEHFLFDILKINGKGKLAKLIKENHSTAICCFLLSKKEKHPAINLLYQYRMTYALRHGLVLQLRQAIDPVTNLVHPHWYIVFQAHTFMQAKNPEIHTIIENSYRTEPQFSNLFNIEQNYQLVSLSLIQGITFNQFVTLIVRLHKQFKEGLLQVYFRMIVNNRVVLSVSDKDVASVKAIIESCENKNSLGLLLS